MADGRTTTGARGFTGGDASDGRSGGTGPLDERLDLARQHFAAGRLEDTARLCCEILELANDHPEAAALLERCSTNLHDQTDLDASLEVLDLPTPPSGSPPTAAAVTNPGIETLSEDRALESQDAADPDRQGEGIDFGDIGDTESLELAEPVPHDEPKRGIDGIAQSEHAAASTGANDEEDESFDLDFAVGELGDDGMVETPPLADDTGSDELAGRIQDLLGEAEYLRKEGQYGDALARIERARILDPSNGAVEALRGVVEKEQATHSPVVLDRLAKADRLARSGEVERAERIYRSVLERVEGHPKALAGLAELERLATADDATSEAPSPAEALAFPEGVREDPLDEDLTDLEPDLAEIPAVAPVDESGAADADLALDDLDLDLEADTDPARTGSSVTASGSRPNLPRWAIFAAGGVVLLAAAFFGWNALSGGSEAPTSPDPAPARPEASATPGDGGAASPAPAPAGPTESLPATLDDTLAAAQDSMDARDWAQAIVLFDHARALEPGNLAAENGLTEAAARYQQQQRLELQWKEIADFFEAGGYREGLRMLYRMPDTVDASRVAAATAAGWYNLGVTALRAGDPAEAIEHFTEALAASPGDAPSRERLAQAEGFVTSGDRSAAYYREVEALRYRDVTGAFSAGSVDAR